MVRVRDRVRVSVLVTVTTIARNQLCRHWVQSGSVPIRCLNDIGSVPIRCLNDILLAVSRRRETDG